MLLAIDVGNTETVVGLFARSGEERASLHGSESGIGIGAAIGVSIGVGASHDPARDLTHHWRLSTVGERTPEEHAVILTQILDLDGLDVGEVVSGIAISSSVPQATTALRQTASRWFDSVPCIVLEPGTKSGMPILYESPKDVGADRVANAVGAFDLHGGPCIVADLGTATTFDVVSSTGEYLGGAIAPGVAISMEALFAHAAALRRVELVPPRSAVGRSTAESIRSGALYGFAAQVDGVCRRIQGEIGPATVIATGGHSALIAPHCEVVDHVEPWLTLHGLRVVFERNFGNEGAPR